MPLTGFSSGVKIHYGNQCCKAKQSVIVKLNKSVAQLCKEQKECYDQLAALSFASQELLNVDMDVDNTEDSEVIHKHVSPLQDDPDVFLVPPLSESSWTIQTLDFYERTTHIFLHAPDAQYTNKTLAHHGFIGVTPDKPVMAFSFKLFEIYRQLHHICPQFSFHPLSTSLVHLHQIPQNSHLTEQLSNGYDCYLEILHVVDGTFCSGTSRTYDCLSTTWDAHPAPHLSTPELNAANDDILWLNIVEHEGAQKVANEYSLQYATMAILWPSAT
ncbi:hypothetical protein L208DRAFT_1375931 [Tricholoma matsutake]|nr:hypothetical protein L208DRAFT_1375931 [Tricholoma matsutake 945]